MRRTVAVSLAGALVIAYGKTVTSRLSRRAGLAAKPPACRTMPSCDETAEQRARWVQDDEIREGPKGW